MTKKLFFFQTEQIWCFFGLNFLDIHVSTSQDLKTQFRLQ